MATVHGGSAKDGLERLAELIAYHSGIELRMARWQVYRSVDLVVHVNGDNRRCRYVTEIVAPSVEEDGAGFVTHRLVAPKHGTDDPRGHAASEPQRWMLDRLTAADPSFTSALYCSSSPKSSLSAQCAGCTRQKQQHSHSYYKAYLATTSMRR